MANAYEPKKLLDGIVDLDDREKEFIESLKEIPDGHTSHQRIERHKIISSFYQTKKTIASNKELVASQNKYSKRLTWWTFGLFAVALAQIVVTVLRASKVIP